MAVFNLKDWTLANAVTPVLQVVKPKIVNLEEKVSDIESYIENLGGDFVGAFDLVSEFPNVDNNGDSIKKGDWALLRVDDKTDSPKAEAGIYFFSGVDWVFGMAIPDIVDILESIVASDAEVDAGTATDKVASVKQLADKYAKIGGALDQKFIVGDAEADSKEAVNASQLSGTITSSEVSSAYDAV